MTVVDFLINGTIYGFIGVFAGLMAGLFGIGGGLIVVPGLLFVFQLNHVIPDNIMMQVAAGTSLGVMIFTSHFSIRAHRKIGDILWPVFNKLWLGIILGTISGAVIAEYVPTYWLKIIFAIFLIFVAFKMLADRHLTHPHRFPSIWLNRLISYFIGLKSGLLGVGGGILIIPYLTYCGIEIRKIAALSSLCSFTVGLVGAIVFIITGLSEMKAISYSTGYVYWPALIMVAIPSSLVAPLGAKLNYVLPVKQLKYVFILILLLTAIKMLF